MDGTTTEQANDIDLATATAIKQAAADRAGLDDTEIGGMVFQLRHLRETGILIDISVGGSTLFSRRANLYELGIPRKSIRGENVTAGSQFMGPRKFVSRQASMAERIRALGKKYCQEVTGFKPYEYLHWKVYDEFKEKWDDLMGQFDEMRNEALENLDEWREAYLEKIALQAEESWTAMMGRKRSALILHLRHEKTKTFENKQAFVEWVVERAEGAFPSEKRVREMMYADYKTAVLLSEADITAEKARDAEELAAIKQARAEQAEAHARAVEAVEQERVAKSEAQLKMQAIHQAELEHARDQIAQITSPFEELFSNLRAQVFAEFQEIAASVRKNGFLNPQVGKRIQNIIKLVQMKDAVNDHKLAALLSKVEQWTAETPKQTGKSGKVQAADPVALGQLEQAVADVVEATRESAITVARRAAAGMDIAALEL